MEVMTVTGPIDADTLGITLSHEHLLLDLRNQFTEFDDPEKRRMSRQPLRMDNLGVVRRNPHAIKDNLLLDDVDLTVCEAEFFKALGGRRFDELRILRMQFSGCPRCCTFPFEPLPVRVPRKRTGIPGRRLSGLRGRPRLGKRLRRVVRAGTDRGGSECAWKMPRSGVRGTGGDGRSWRKPTGHTGAFRLRVDRIGPQDDG